MKKISCFLAPLAVALLVALTVGSQFAQAQEWTGYYQRTPFQYAPASTFEAGLLGYTNPAITQMVENDLRFFWNTVGRDYTSIQDWGLFAGGRGFGLNVLRRRSDDFAATDYRLNFGFGDRSAAGGIAYQWSNGDEAAFGLRNMISTGIVTRPSKYVSTGLAGNLTTKVRSWEAIGELGIRPMGNPRLTLFADGALREGQALTDMPWSVGAAAEIVSGVNIVGRYLSNERFSAGLTIDFGRVGTGSQLHFDADADYTSGTQMLRAGQFMPNIFTKKFRQNTRYTSMELRGRIDYRQRPLAGLLGQDTPRLYEIIHTIQTAAADNRVSVIALNLSGIQVLPEHAWEIRSELRKARRSGKKVIVFLDNGGMEAYHLASIADRVVMDPMGTLLLPGYLSNRTYFAGSLEKLGIGFEAWRYFEYKSAVEAFSRDDMSPADEEQLQAFVDDQYELVRSNVAASRPITRNGFDEIINNRTLLTAEEALEEGLVDTLARWNDLDAVMTDVAGEEKSRLPTDFLLQDARVTRSWQGPARIALVYALGTTAMDQGIEARSLHEKIRSLGENESIRAIVFRVDSPGGDPLAADLVAEALRKAATHKPVIVTQGQVAASGGYWISMYADSIVAGPNTVTGSIGVIGGWLHDTGFGSKLGMTSDHVQRGDHADLMAGVSVPLLGLRLPARNLTDAEQSRVRDHILALYDKFVSKVAEGRDTTESHVRDVAEGRIWSGTDAREAGLVDIIGGMSNAIDRARRAAGIPDDRKLEVVEVGHEAGLFEGLPFASPVKNTTQARDPLREYLELFIEHQPHPLVIIRPGIYPWYDPSADLDDR